MGVLLACNNLTRTFPHRVLFRGITLGLFEGERAGLIGRSGSGKSTLLRIIAGLDHADEGELTPRRGLHVGYVAQDDDLPADRSIEEQLFDATACLHSDDAARWTRVGGTISKLEFDDPSKTTRELSGGWRKRLAIACQIIREPHLLLLDEPTNHLDLEGIWWLESLLADAQFASLIVSHDRAFLENVATRIIDLGQSYPEGFLEVQGAYHEFVVKREEFLAAQASREVSLAGRVRREIEWLSRKAKARTTKAQGRITRANELMSELAAVRERNTDPGAAGLDFVSTGRRSRKLLKVTGLAKSLGGRRLFEQVEFMLGAGDKLGLLGLNGSGKTTLLRLLTGELQPDAGEVWRAENLRVVMFDQAREQLDGSQTLRAALAPAGGDTVVYRDRATHVASWARRFLFRTEQLDTHVGDLSGGEQSRVLIARLMLRPADVLILDEPTNDLDLQTLDVLEESLEDFPGALVLVTHDRYLLDRLSTQLLALDGRGGAKMYAELSQWERDRQAQLAAESGPRGAAGSAGSARAGSARATSRDGTPTGVASKPGRSGTPRPEKKPKLTWAERLEWEKMEATILAAEREVQSLHAEIEKPATLADHVRLRDLCTTLESRQAAVDQLYRRWAELEAKKAAADGAPDAARDAK